MATTAKREFKKQMLDSHRAAFDLWRRVATLLEDVVALERTANSAFARALDLFFVEAFKSHQSVYLLSVRGLGEDAATIVRRLFEIALQVGYLCSEDTQREQRGATYLAYFWLNAKDILARDLPDDVRLWWQSQYKCHEQFIQLDAKGRPLKSWFGANFSELASKLGLQASYDDYRLLSSIAHCSSRGLLLDWNPGKLEINSNRLIRAILIFGSRYALAIAEQWNSEFALIDADQLRRLKEKAIGMDLNVGS